MRKKLNEELAEALYREGRRDREIAELTGTSLSMIQKWRHGRGLEENRGRLPEGMQRIASINALARAAGMSYGQYQAARREKDLTKAEEWRRRVEEKKAKRRAAQTEA